MRRASWDTRSSSGRSRGSSRRQPNYYYGEVPPAEHHERPYYAYDDGPGPMMATTTTDDDDDAPPPMEASMVCMTVVADGPSIAFCCYDEERNEILLESVPHATSDDTETIVERFLQIARPNLVLVGSKMVNHNPAFLEMITKPPPTLLVPNDDDDDDDDDPTAAQETGGGLGATGTGISADRDDSDTTMRPSVHQSLPYRMLKTGAFEIRACRALILQKLRVVSLLRQEAREHNPIGYGDRYRAQRQFPLASAAAAAAAGAEASYEQYQPSSYHALAAVVDFDSKVQVQALGALLSFLQGTVFRLEDSGIVTVHRIVQARSSLYMNINAATFSALHIFSTEHHPLIAKGPGHAKEGFSLYSLLDRTQSKGGRQLLREWMMKPLIDVDAIRARHDAVELFLQTTLQTTTGVLLTFLAKIGPVDQILTRMQKCATQPQDFLVLTRTLAAAVAISNILQSDILPGLGVVEEAVAAHDPPRSHHHFLYDIFHRCNAPVLAALQQDIVDIVDDELTAEVKTSVVIRRGFHPELDDMKDQYETLEDTLEDAGAAIQRQHPELDLSVVFVPQVGFLVALDKALILSSHAMELPEDFTHIFNQDDEAFFKTLEMRELDDEIGDLHGLIKDTECMIVTDLEETLLDAEPELRESFKALSELDCILAFADCAYDLKYIRPHMTKAVLAGAASASAATNTKTPINTNTNRIHIKEGRHPLQEIITEREFVPNDTHIDQQEERVNIITGPNFSGKSCYLRQVGVLVYMAHIGSFIPCQEAEISVVDQICARISAVETCAVPQSSFQLDLTQMAAILLRCTSRSLVLIDEFGKGTSPASGIAILGGAIKKLAAVGCKTVCTTHFLELFSMGVIEDGKNGIRARQMTIHLPRGNDDDDGAAPLFKLKDGVASSSAGLICAKKAGINPKIIARAKEIIQTMRDRRPIEPLKEAMPQGADIHLGGNELEMLHFFVSVENWADATDDQIRTLIQKLSLMEV